MVIISHRPATIGVVDKILVIRDGVAEMFGPRAEILGKSDAPRAGSGGARRARPRHRQLMNAIRERRSCSSTDIRRIRACRRPAMRRLAGGVGRSGAGQFHRAACHLPAGLSLRLFSAASATWAATAPLNGAVVATRVVKVEGNRKSVQHLDGGIVKDCASRKATRSRPAMS